MLALSQIGQPQEVESRIWASLRELDVNADSVVRISNLPSHFFAASASILNDNLQGVYTSIDPRRGVMRVVVAANGENERADLASTGASVDFTSGGSSQVIFEKLPPDVWAQVSPSVVADPLSQGIRKAYDPHNILNPGILGD